MVKTQTIDNQFKQLQSLSNKISEMINNEDFSKIYHLDSIRKKIINDIKQKNLNTIVPRKETIVKLIHQNDQLVLSLEKKQKDILVDQNRTIKCHKQYLKHL
tara:strand:- start:10613 stop:10918 length:306 start_codon:yes stop_codon:yes gene_type:complete